MSEYGLGTWLVCHHSNVAGGDESIELRSLDDNYGLEFRTLRYEQETKMANRLVACVNFLAGIPTEDLLLLEADKRAYDAWNGIIIAIGAAKAKPMPRKIW